MVARILSEIICGEETRPARAIEGLARPVANAGTMLVSLLCAGGKDDTVHAQILDHLAVMIAALSNDPPLVAKMYLPSGIATATDK
jgi:hypothetical protein